MNWNQGKRKFFLEGLEQRTCLAAAVTLSAGNLLVTNDFAADLVVTQTAADTWTVTDAGSPVGVGTFTGVTGNVTIRTQTADDQIEVDLNGQTAPKCVIVDSGAGADQVSIHGGTIGQTLDLRSGGGDDTVTVDGTTVNGLVNINTGNGTNGLSVTNSSSKWLSIATGDGDDTVTLGDGTNPVTVTNAARIYDNGGPNDVVTVKSGVSLGSLMTTHVNNVSLETGSDITGGLVFISGYNVANSLSLQGTVDGNVAYYGSGGSDSLTLGAAAAVGGSVGMLSDGGADTVDLQGLITNSLLLEMGSGSDQVHLGGQIGNKATISLGTGDDFFELLGKIGVAPATSSRLWLDAGAGNDRVALRAGSEVNGSALINMGAGDDELASDDLALIISALVNGGSGSDKYYGTLPRAGVTQTSFETLLTTPPPF